MALPRGRAQVNTDARLGILFRWDGQPTDPHEVRKMELIATDGQTVLATVETFEHDAGTGEYYATVSGALIPTAGRYIDKWYYTWADGEAERTSPQDFYVQEISQLSHYGADILAGVGHLKCLPPLAANAQDGVTQTDLDLAMATADSIIESLFGGDYDISSWRTTPPALVSLLWELFASAKVIEFRDLRAGIPGDATTSAAVPLVRSARELLDKILHGWPERLYLRDSQGNIIQPRKNRASTVPRAKITEG